MPIRVLGGRARSGFSAVELTVVLAIVAILAVAAFPTFDGFRVRERLKGAATNLYTDLQYARSEAVQRNAVVTVSFRAGADWCYGIHRGAAACDCTTLGSCSIKAVSGADFPGISLGEARFESASGTTDWYAIDPRVGQILDAAGRAVTGDVVFVGSGSRSLRGDLSPVGRMRLCSPSGSVSGFPSC